MAGAPTEHSTLQRSPSFWRRSAVTITLTALLAAALALRLYGINWDSGHLFHPDERAILWCVNDLGHDPSYYTEHRFCGTEKAPWNPAWFPYGSFPLYLLKGVQIALSPVAQLGLAELRIPGRALSALADTLTVLLVFLLGARLFGRRTGLLAAAFAAFAVLHIQLSHFYTVDTLLTLLVVLAVLAMVPVAARGSLRAAALAGAFTGLALATKFSAAPLLLPLGLAPLLYAVSGTGDHLRFSRPTEQRLTRAVGALVVGIAVAGVTFFVAQPYGVLDWREFAADVLEQGQMVRRVLDYPYTRQYIGTTPYLYHVSQLTRFGLGWPLGIVAWAGLLFGMGALLWGRRKGDLLILAWVLAYFGIVGGFQVKFLRYMLPVTPFLLLYGARMLVALYDHAKRLRLPSLGWLWRKVTPARAVAAVIALVVGATAFYALAYEGIYAGPHPAVRASDWLRSNATPGSLVLKEHWDEAPPNLSAFQMEELPLYDPDTPAKASSLAEQLGRADYLVLYSNRLYGTIPRLPERYPMSTGYYQLLFSGELGYQLAHFEVTEPKLPGLALADDTFARPGLPVPGPLAQWKPALLTLNLGAADESFTVYDHPKVLVFRNDHALSSGQIAALLREKLASPTAGAQQRKVPALLTSSEWRAQQAGGTWREIIHPASWPARMPVLAWLLVVYAFSLAVAPLVFLACRGLPDRGYLLSRPLGLLLFAYLPWLGASLKMVAFSQASVLGGLGVLLALGLVLGWWQRRALGDFCRRRWKLLAVEEAVFLAAFLSFTLVRMANPDLWHPFRGGEKPMDLAYLNAVVRST
ncbi:MAG: glycosyltransferase family 39 protein, partial [Chloroflexi bacterium]|nr:glycosyltransferase family 39 protein [Chloroflexota bacterium]